MTDRVRSGQRFRRKGSLVFSVILLYLSLTLINLLIFWFSMGADQLRLIADNSVLAARTTGYELHRQLKSIAPSTAATPAQLHNETESALRALPGLAGRWALFEGSGKALEPQRAAQYPVVRLLKAQQASEYYKEPFTVFPDLVASELEIVIPLNRAKPVFFVAWLKLPSIRQQVLSMVRSGAALSAALLLAQALFGWLLYRRYARPLLELVRSVVAFRRNQETPPVLTERTDEIGYLHHAFSQMAVTLAKKNQQLTQAMVQAQNRQQQLEFDLELGRTIQNAIMPSAWNHGKAEIRVFFRPVEQVSGDYYDFFNHADGRLSVLLADAMGHSVPAALVTMMTKVHFMNLVDQIADPAALLVALHRQLRKIPLGLSYLTAAYFVLREDLSFSYAIACHMPIFWYHAETGTVTLLQGRGFLLGLENREIIEAHSGVARPGDRMLFFTDGLIEPGADNDSLLGKAQRAFGEAAEFTLTDCYEYLVVNLVSPHAERSDDITFILLEITGGVPQVQGIA